MQLNARRRSSTHIGIISVLFLKAFLVFIPLLHYALSAKQN